MRVATAVRKMQQHLFRFVLFYGMILELLNIYNRYRGYLGTYLIIVGVDVTGSHIATVHPHGSAAFLPFVASG